MTTELFTYKPGTTRTNKSIALPTATWGELERIANEMAIPRNRVVKLAVDNFLMQRNHQ